MIVGKHRGFTLIELLITLLILVIIIALAIPLFQRLMAKWEAEDAYHEMYRQLLIARKLAIAETKNMVVCQTEDGTRCIDAPQTQYIVFNDVNNNLILDTEEQLVYRLTAKWKYGRMFINRKALGFRSNFGGSGGYMGSYIYCGGDKALHRAVMISIHGYIRKSLDSNGDGVHEGASKESIACE